jgi:hypothetical protein
MKWDALNYDQGVPFANEAALDSWLSEIIIPEAEKLINDFCVRPDFSLHEDEEELFSGDGFRNQLLLSYQPIVSVSKIEIKNSDSSWSTMSTDDYYALSRHVVSRSVLPTGFRNIRVTYDWGYASLPPDASYCAAEMVARFLQKRSVYKMGPLVRVSDYRVQLSNPEVFTDDLKAILGHYRSDATSIR